MELKKAFNIGDEVSVSAEGGWPGSLRGIVGNGPEPVQTRQGQDYYYWVRFDSPVRDSDGDGSYKAAQILSRFLSLTRADYSEVADSGFEARTWDWLIEQNLV